MPKLRETRLQIQERTAREIRLEDVSQAIERERVVQEDRADDGLQRELERDRRFEAVCFRLHDQIREDDDSARCSAAIHRG